MSVKQGSRVIHRIAFRPQHGDGQTVAFTAVAGVSAAMTTGKAHWLWSDEDCWIRINGVPTTFSFPIPARAPVEYTPTQVGVDDVVQAIQISTGGNLYIGRSED